MSSIQTHQTAASQTHRVASKNVAAKIAITAAMIAAAPLAGQGNTTEPADAATVEPKHIVQFVRFESSLPREAVLKAAAERKPLFEAMPGLVQKYYLELDAANTYGGIYI